MRITAESAHTQLDHGTSAAHHEPDKALWGYGVYNACTIADVMPHPDGSGSPNCKWAQADPLTFHDPNLPRLRVFGCHTVVHRCRKLVHDSKLDACSAEGIYVGLCMPFNHNSWLVLTADDNLYTAVSVMCYETRFPRCRVAGVGGGKQVGPVPKTLHGARALAISITPDDVEEKPAKMGVQVQNDIDAALEEEYHVPEDRVEEVDDRVRLQVQGGKIMIVPSPEPSDDEDEPEVPSPASRLELGGGVDKVQENVIKLPSPLSPPHTQQGTQHGVFTAEGIPELGQARPKSTLLTRDKLNK